MSLRVAGIGLGGVGMSQLQHSASLDGITVIAGADVAPEAREEFTAEFDAPVYESHELLLEKHAEGLEAVLIATPHTHHYAPAKACLEANVDVHVEKPLVTGIDDAVDLIETADRHDVKLQVGFQRHLEAGYQQTRRVIQEGRIGSVHMVSCYLAQDWIQNQLGAWRTTPELSGGGELYDSGAHLLDAVFFLTESEPATVAATMDYQGHDVDVNSALAATLDGPEGQITASIGVCGDGPTMEEQFVVWGTKGHVKYADETLWIHEKGEEQAQKIPIDGADENKLEAFFEAVRGHREIAIPAEYGLRVVALTESAYEAHKSGKSVDIRERLRNARDYTVGQTG